MRSSTGAAIIFSFLGKKLGVGASRPARSDTLSLFPLAITLFPGGRMSLKVFEQRYYELAKDCIASGESFGVVTLLAGSDVGSNQSFAKVGTAVTIASFDAPQPNMFLLDVIGDQRFEILSSRVRRNGLHQATVRWLPNEEKKPVAAEYASIVSLLKPVVEGFGEARFSPPFEFDDATWVSSRLTEILSLPPKIKQSMLEINDSELRLKTLTQLISMGKSKKS